MGRDKAFLQIAGKTIFEQILTLFKECFDRVVLVGGRAERFAGCGLPVLPDIYPGSALGGLYTGLWHAETEYIFVSSCDLPFPNRELLLYLCSLRDGFDAVIPKPAHGFEPLFAVYAKSCIGPIRESLENGNFCAYAYYPQIRARYVDDAELVHIDRDGRSFLNVNTPEEFEIIKTGGSS
ncbi:MAG: molybdenum cofactor guanylyltransferase [Syntrophales bacterium]